MRVLFSNSTGEIAERGVPADRVVERLDVLEDLADQLAPGGPAAPADELLLDRGKEALCDSVS
jgi:hypothetical protein